MRSILLFSMIFATRGVLAQDTAPHIATKSTVVRSAPTTGAAPSPALAQIAKGATVDVIARDRDWVRVRLEGWVSEADLAVADSTLRPLSAADIRSNPSAARGMLVRWEVEAVALQTADALRTGLQPGEQYLLALGPGAEKVLVYIVVPETLLATARSLPPLAQIIVTARVRNGRSEPAGVAILDLQSLTRR
ncbi:MAG: SH3 domain-containing protein [Gemmatimonadales bacterium]